MWPALGAHPLEFAPAFAPAPCAAPSSSHPGQAVRPPLCTVVAVASRGDGILLCPVLDR